MTDNPHNSSESDGAKRVIGTPVDSDEVVTSTESSAEDDRHEGPYPASETHGHSEERQRTGERMAAAWFVVAFLAGVGFIVSYFLFPPGPDDTPVIADPGVEQLSNLMLGGTLTIALFALAAGMTVWVRRVMPHYEVSSPYDDLPSSPEKKSSFSEFFMRGANESGFTKRPLMRRTLLLSMLPLGIAPIVLLRDAGPLPGDKLRHTMWEDGHYMVVEGTTRHIKATDLEVGGMIAVLPENTEDPDHPVSLNEQAKSSTILIKMDPEDFGEEMTDERIGWTHDGIVAYSKICTHVGCPAALYERTTHRILCPCHQSTFDAANAAKVVFGPAARPLPQLPIRVDSEGYLVAAGDFSSPVGPTFWDAEKED
ncbi:Rieske 2Fe-2S domain-containing protein [Spiractinospora alimapuensis]|uniref:cytochrome bc1 complex Rieske iron-sulfur subunit n=1 Tax=Spiractinospora alimapuensis TaxID=2820884 RepID=UPI001F2E1A10|nr:Rieske 2Fe-2S domain-containing protein [Spiractinospora alimapuensis]QVQ53238.1 Rieske 2Fe-2S domain-containing protein [Spiractinospora alimapuensis]